MKLKGNVEEIIFRNDDNGYTVFVVESDNNFVTCVGKCANLNKGEDVEVEGNFTKSKFGKQFSFSNLKISKPKTIAGIKKYLSSGLIKGVGESTAEKIVSKFKQDTLDIISFAPERLAEIKGISKRKAIEIGENFNASKNMQDAIMFLQQYGITINLALKIFDKYQEETVSTVSQNPYKLVEDVDGIGFLTADRIAVNMGLALNSNFRVRAGILHCLKDASEKQGHTFLPKKELFGLVFDLLGLSEELLSSLFDEEIEGLVLSNFIKVFEREGESCVCTKSFYYMESTIAGKLSLLSMSQIEVNLNVEEEIQEFERANKVILHETQKEAIERAVKGQVTVITGGPGTGKTTIVKCILGALSNFTKKILLLAPTGRASKRLSEACNHKASTIHRALEVNFKDDDKPYFVYNERKKLDAEVCIVDEMSMVDVSLFSALLKALKNNCKLILVGDKDQLPSVGAGNVLKDIISSETIPCIKLSHIYRQNDQSLIVLNAHKINEGKMPDLSNHSLDFFYENKEDPPAMFDTVINLVTKRLPSFCKCEGRDIQVLCAMKSGVCGIENLNNRLQEILNPSEFRKNEIAFEKRVLRENDKVMQTVNNYDLIWNRSYPDGTSEEGKGIFNGDMGKILKIDRQTGETLVWFDDDRICTYSKLQASELAICYATTIHKSQGSEFDFVVIPVVAGSPQIITRNLLYTAVTRAKKLVVLVGPKKNIARMVYNNYTTNRYTMLENLLKLQKQKADILYG